MARTSGRRIEDLASIRELISEAKADVRELRAATVKSHQQLGDHQGADELREIANNVLFALDVVARWLEREEEEHEAQDMRGMAGARLDLIRQKRDKLNQLLEEREQYVTAKRRQPDRK